MRPGAYLAGFRPFWRSLPRASVLYAEAAGWLEDQATDYPERDHTDRLFVELVLRTPARAHLERTEELEQCLTKGEYPTPRRLLREYRRLAALFRVEITSFERKRYVNLSHESNKAMNLNSYIALIGHRFHEVVRPDGLYLERTDATHADLSVPPAEYIATLDADSLLTFDYALRLVHVMTQPANERTAVAQTPYSAVPRPKGLLERIAGATTDIQHIIHQGFGAHNATYWVGANALLRKAALDDLRLIRIERGFEIAVFVQDHTVIEDTESSVDLVERGWSLYNYPARLAYSATPADFGALLIQRRRWANGGLIILPKLLRYLLRGPWSRPKLAEAAMRCHYLTSIAGVNLGLLLLLLYPFEHSMRDVWLPLTALPYFALYGRDLVQCGYRAGDVVRAYALNLMLLPVNLGGVFKSIQQALTGRKTPFGRTPKVENRTAVPPLYILAEWALIAALVCLITVDITRGRWLHALFGVVNGGLLLYAILHFMGVRESLEDLGRHFKSPPGLKASRIAQPAK
jgi:hypothetical protein